MPTLATYCARCHAAKDNSDMSLVTLAEPNSFRTHKDVWTRVVAVLQGKIMPPPGNHAPGDAERANLIAAIDKALAPPKPNPGHVTMRRLNRAEYDNTIRDLCGVNTDPASDFPSDDVGYGFDNIGDVLSMSPLLLEKYMKAATDIADAAIYTPSVHTWRFKGSELEGPNSSKEEDVTCLYSNGVVSRDVELPVAGDYKLTVRAHQDKAGDEDAKMSFDVNGKVVGMAAVHSADAPQTVEIRFHAPAGHVSIGAGFTNDFYVPKTATNPGQDRNLYIHSIEISGPVGGVTSIPKSESRIIFVKPTPTTRIECERRILAAFAARAYRRPPTKAEVDKLVALAELVHKNGDSFERGIQLGVTAALCSPNFLFRVEKPVNGLLSSYEIASRLSFFLWSSMPDDELFALAAKNQLQNPQILAQQIARMLKDPKADALADNFAGQWLETRKLSEVRPDRKLFPEYTQEIRRDMETETKMFFEDVVRNDRSILDFLDGNYSFVNGPLAQVYGIAGVNGPSFQRVEMPPQRAGVITQGSVLVVTSNPTRTSPVKRGKWILENILGTPPPPPPPGVGVLKDDSASVATLTLKQRMEQHRKDPMCAACHKQMDGLGFALENFDAVGAWRTKDGNFDIDASGELPDGSKFTGPVELRDILMKKKELFVRCLAEKMLTYAIGRGLESYDDPAVDRIVASISDGQYRFSALVKAIVESDPFRKSVVEK